MNKFEITFTAVMATIIAHLLVAVIFMSVKIAALKRDVSDAIVIEIEAEAPAPEELNMPDMTNENIAGGNAYEDIVNVAKNIADQPIDIDPEEYQNMIKEEMIKGGMLGENNFIDEQKKAEESGREEIAIPKEEIKPQVTQKKEKPEEKGTFRGPTRIFYDLTGRHHTYLPIPIYKCEGAGQVTLLIEVDRGGNVTKAQPTSELSTTSDECLTETAVTYAMRSKFNSSLSAPVLQSGFLTFVFVAQH
jgi:hypothetical protein